MRNCDNGPNISFPLYIPGLPARISLWLYPGFALNCNNESFPVLQLSDDNEHVVGDIYYANSHFRVYDSAVSSPSSCPRIRNTTLPTAQCAYANNVTGLHLLSNCTDPLPEGLNDIDLALKVSCVSEDYSNNWTLAVYDNDFRLKDALENCRRNVTSPVEGHGYDGNNQQVTLVEILRKGFVLSWTASDYRPCEDSGGHCGFNETTCHLRSCPQLRKKRSLGLILGSGLGAAVLVVASISILIILTKRKMMKNALNGKNMEVFLKQYGNLAPRRYKYSELKKMTKSFSGKLGQGGYGSVYKAKSKDGRPSLGSESPERIQK